MNRGSLAWRPVVPFGPCRFNEAPIHESGKSPEGAPSEEDRRSFNEAPIHESGKSYWQPACSRSLTRLQ